MPRQIAIRLTLVALALVVFFAGRFFIQKKTLTPWRSGTTLSEARHGFDTKLTRRLSEKYPADEPPAGELRLVKYASTVGPLLAYLSVAPSDDKRHPAIIWITGGFSNSISAAAWAPADPSNDQSARAFRENGVVTMYPSLRGGNENPGFKEGFYGEVDDILAAARFLATQNGVDPAAIYLGGHSTGGTLALLCAEMPNHFRAIFCFGPVSDIRAYGTDDLPFNTSKAKEVYLRAPGRWLDSIHAPTFIFAGTEKPSNIRSLWLMKRGSKNPQVHFLPVEGATHFTILAPITTLIAKAIVKSYQSGTDVTIDGNQLQSMFRH